MIFKILGSGGCTSIPKPTCQCNICSEARLKGEPYKRSSCCLYVKDLKLLIDTPEDVNYQINRDNITEIENIFYSHWDPDHTLGIRLLEQLRLNWIDYFRGIKCSRPINIIGLPEVIDDIYNIKNKYGSYLDYYKSHNLCLVNKTNKTIIKNIDISLVPIISNIVSTSFVFKYNNKKVIYAPCDNKPFPNNSLFNNADLLIMGGFIPTENFNHSIKIPLGNDIYTAMFTIDEIIHIKESFNIKTVVLTHLEENWGLSYDDYKKMEVSLKMHNILFSYDGMEIEI
ncbi:MBL fold metallo-hydrolase [Clostridium sp.]|uniref:MBL fold metallo-hydrolase n=1 Tax=Clostridium sp. TaxID=1506 RepID=UPI003F31CD69